MCLLYTQCKTRNKQSIIDYIIINKQYKNLIEDTSSVRRGYEIGSDHFMIETKINLRTKQSNYKPDTCGKYKINTYKLRKPEIRSKFIKMIEEKFDNQNNKVKAIDINIINNEWMAFKKIIIKAAEKYCGRVKTGDQRKITHWWNEHLKQETNKKKKLWQEYVSKKNGGELQLLQDTT